MDGPPPTEVAALLVDTGSSVGIDAQQELLTGYSLGPEARSILADVERYQRQPRSQSFEGERLELVKAIARPRRHNPRVPAAVVRYAAGKQRVLTADQRLARRLALAATELSRNEPIDLADTLRNLRPDALPLREIVVARYASPPARLSMADLESIAARLEPGERLLELAPLLVDDDLDEEQLRRRREELLAYRVAVLGLEYRGISPAAIRAGSTLYGDPAFELGNFAAGQAAPLESEFEDQSANEPPRPDVPPPPDQPPPPPPPPPHDKHPGAPVEAGHQRHAWPLLEAPDAVAPEQEFTVSVGLSASPVARVGGSGRLALPSGPFTLDLELMVDPDSFKILDGSAQRSLPVTPTDPYPSLTMKLSARVDQALKRERELGCTFRVDGVLCGYATRKIEIVPAGEVPEGIKQDPAVAPPIEVLELDRETLPDLTIVIKKGDDTAATKLVWKLYSPCLDVPLDLAPTDVGESPQDFTKNIIDTASVSSDDPLGLFDHLVGSGRLLGQHMPPEARSALTALSAAVKGGVPTVLIASADPYLPWELTVLDEIIPDEESPFLGGRAAIGRWPLTGSKPAPKPSATVVVRDRAVVSGSYMKVQGVSELMAAEAEGEDLLRSWPGSHPVEPTYASVRKLMFGDPGVDLVHVALHGKFSDTIRNGLVLIGREEKGVRKPYFLQPNQILAWSLRSRPFVFLNACQVGAGTLVLGDHAGTASSLLTAGASSVIAPLWSIDDSVARTMAIEFYEAALDEPDGNTVAVAEFLRRARASFTQSAIDAGEGAGASTYLAFQYFGHPRLELRKPAV